MFDVMVDIIPQVGNRCVTFLLFFHRFCTFFVVVFSDIGDGDGDDEEDEGKLSREDSGFVVPKKKKAKLVQRGKGIQWGVPSVFKDTSTFLASKLGKELTDRFSIHKTYTLKKTNGKSRIST